MTQTRNPADKGGASDGSVHAAKLNTSDHTRATEPHQVVRDRLMGLPTIRERQRLPDRRASETFAVECGGLNYTVTVSRYADGRLGEIFIDMIKAGSAADMAARDSAIVCSLALQYGADVETVRRALCRDARGEASGPLGAALDRLRAMEAER